MTFLENFLLELEMTILFLEGGGRGGFKGCSKNIQKIHPFYRLQASLMAQFLTMGEEMYSPIIVSKQSDIIFKFKSKIYL